MIGFLRGQVCKEGVVEAGGIGWSVHSPDTLPVGTEVALHVTTVARDGSMSLYGFVDPTDQVLFDALCRVARVGPAMAVSILAMFTPGELARIVQDRDAGALAKVPGVGRKSAETICNLVTLPGGIEAETSEGTPSSATHEVVATLIDLGFDEHRSDEVVRGLLHDADPGSMGDGSLDEATLLRQALSLLRAVP